MQCDKCSKQIPDGEKYVAFSRSTETLDGSVADVHHSTLLETYCLGCAPKRRYVIELSENELRVIGGWASFGRTFDVIGRCLEDSEHPDVEIAESELKTVRGPLTDIAHRIRDQIWTHWAAPTKAIKQKLLDGEIDDAQAIRELEALGYFKWKAIESVKEHHKWVAYCHEQGRVAKLD